MSAAAAPLLQAAPRADRVRGLFRALLLSCIVLSAAMLVTLLLDVAFDGAGRLSVNFLTNSASSDPAIAGVWPALVGTLWLMGICVLFIVPVGIAAAIYLEEYADPSRWWNRLIEVNIQNLAAVPSIVYGILGLAFIVRGPVDVLGLGRGDPIVLAGGLTLGLLVLPVVIIAGREAIRAVPPSIREGSLALGATQWQTIRRQVLPAAVPGIATGVILALSRAIGETAPLIVIGTAAFVPFAPTSYDSRYTALPVQMLEWISRPQEEFHQLAAAAILVLLAVLLLMNSVAIWLRTRYESKW
ncbi:MAG TPA: phosphate ABC transporter permease PstA [Solirubrobacteraceae bacterium]|nr:phosphate ABC transporter permease PstA [Solirubrobacteraceae bacterium]